MPTMEFTLKQLQQEQVLSEMLSDRISLILTLSQELAQVKRINENLAKRVEELTKQLEQVS